MMSCSSFFSALPRPLLQARRVLLSGWLASFVLPCAHGATYYVANAGSDTNNGLSAATPFKTIAKVNTITSLLQAGDQVLLKAGDRFTDDYLRCQNLVAVTNATTLRQSPPVCSGTATAPVLFGRYGAGPDPILEAADRLSGLNWRSLGNGVYSTSLSTAPQKLYVDEQAESVQLTPVPNYVGYYDASGRTTYQPWDAVYNQANGQYVMNGSNVPQSATVGGLGVGGAWGSPYKTASSVGGETTQTFQPTRTGLQNVSAIGGGSVALSLSGGVGYPNTFSFTSSGGGSVAGVACQVNGTITAVNGVPQPTVAYTANHGCSSVPTIVVAQNIGGTGLKFYGRVDGGSFFYSTDGGNGALAHELYVHLADGSDPSQHSFFGTHRPYGVLLRGVNYVTVSHIQFAHQQKSGLLSFPYSNSSLLGSYWTNEYIHASHLTCWNTGDTVNDTLGWQSGLSRTAVLEGCVVMRASGETDPHFLRGLLIEDSWSGTIDSYYGSRGDTTHASFLMSGVDGTETTGGVRSSLPVIQYSYGRSMNAACIRYGTAGLSLSKAELNQGGIVTNNECTGNANGNIFFGATAGGRVSTNFVHESLGEGIQAGGNSTSVSDESSSEAQLFDHNVLANLGYSASLTLYNGIDVNDGNEGPLYPYTTDLHIANNTIVNAAAACITLEANIVAAHVHDNVCTESSSYYPAGWECPICTGTTNYAASIYVRMASILYPVSMDWHNNAWQNQGGPLKSWSVYNLQNVGSDRGTCTNLGTFLHLYNSAAKTDASSFCIADPAFNNTAELNFTLNAGSGLINAGSGGQDIGALPYGQAMFPFGPRSATE